MRVNTNIAALNALRNLEMTNHRLDRSLERLASGLRINRAADDAAGLAISEKMRGQIRGLNQAIRNAQDGISLIQTAEGALNESHAILQRMRELAVQAASDTYTAADRQEIQKEMDQLTTELNRIASTTEFNTKRLLDGTTSALTSTDRLSTQVFMRDGLRVEDQFGQKAAGGGNFRIGIEASPGRAQVLKTDQMKIKHDLGTAEVETLVTGGAETNEQQQITLSRVQGGTFTLTFTREEVQTIDLDTPTSGNFILGRGEETQTLQHDATAGDVQDALDTLYGEGAATVEANTAGFVITFSAELGEASGLTFESNLSSATGAEMELTWPHADTTTDIAYDASAGTVQTALLDLDTIPADGVAVTGGDGGPWTVTFQNGLGNQDVAQLVLDDSGLEGIGQVGDLARLDSRIYDIDRFWDASGNFLVQDPQTITLVQGDGSRASFTIFENDTVRDVQDKMNAALAEGLGQEQYMGEEAAFARFVVEPTETGHESVRGTFVLRSAVAGQSGEINFVGSEKVINALSLTTIQQARENQFTVNVTEAHTGEEVATDVAISGNMLVGVVHPNVDVRFDNMANVSVGVDTNGDFVFSQSAEEYFTTVHLADNTMVFHIGANPLQDVATAIGDMRASALGVDNIQVAERELANRAIAQIDGAIDRVSAERSRMGAMQNRLEHTIANLGTSAENLTAAESRIRDLDMAQEMAEFTRNQILLQAGTAMLAQANMKPQAVLQLLG